MIPETGNHRDFKHWVLANVWVMICPSCRRPFIFRYNGPHTIMFCPVCTQQMEKLKQVINDPQTWQRMDWSAMGIVDRP